MQPSIVLRLRLLSLFFADTGITIVPYSFQQAAASGNLAAITRKAGLSLGDRSCLSLAQELKAEVLTADRAWVGFADSLGLAIGLLR